MPRPQGHLPLGMEDRVQGPQEQGETKHCSLFPANGNSSASWTPIALDYNRPLELDSQPDLHYLHSYIISPSKR